MLNNCKTTVKNLLSISHKKLKLKTIIFIGEYFNNLINKLYFIILPT